MNPRVPVEISVDRGECGAVLRGMVLCQVVTSSWRLAASTWFPSRQPWVVGQGHGEHSYDLERATTGDVGQADDEKLVSW